MRSDTSKGKGALGSWPGSRTGVARFADASTDVTPIGPASRSGFGRVGLAREVAAVRREIALLKKENAALRFELNAERRA